MRFWDTSAIVPLFLNEPHSEAVTKALKDDRDMITWWGSSVECVSAIRRRERDGRLSAPDLNRALELLSDLEESWSVILPGSLGKSTAKRLLAVHQLRAADSLQLASAITWRDNPSERPEFVCLDERLSDAAAREGFRCLPAT